VCKYHNSCSKPVQCNLSKVDLDREKRPRIQASELNFKSPNQEGQKGNENPVPAVRGAGDTFAEGARAVVLGDNVTELEETT
jgi:hypothetical protein